MNPAMSHIPTFLIHSQEERIVHKVSYLSTWKSPQHIRRSTLTPLSSTASYILSNSPWQQPCMATYTSSESNYVFLVYLCSQKHCLHNHNLRRSRHCIWLLGICRGRYSQIVITFIIISALRSVNHRRYNFYHCHNQ